MTNATQIKLIDCAKVIGLDNPSWKSLVEKSSDPNWTSRYDWESYVPNCLAENWDDLSEEVQVAVFLFAKQSKKDCNWGWDIL
jgi:hypothetical protein